MDSRATHKRKSRMARPGNSNARKCPAWGDFDVSSPQGVMKFIPTLIKATWTGQVGTRQSSAISGLLRLILEYDADIQHLKEIETKMGELEREVEVFRKGHGSPNELPVISYGDERDTKEQHIANFVKSLSIPLQNEVFGYVRQQAEAEGKAKLEQETK